MISNMTSTYSINFLYDDNGSYLEDSYFDKTCDFYHVINVTKSSYQVLRISCYNLFRKFQKNASLHASDVIISYCL